MLHLGTWQDLGRIEAALCARFNRLNQRPQAGHFFGLISRLGDGAFWYALMAMMPLVYQDWHTALTMAVTGVAATVVYKSIKHVTRRLRPCEAYPVLHLTVAPLDRFSFPSGHTLHAVGFTLLACHAHPELGWFLIPFTALVACSRLVLGLHYPSDVLTGALIGAGLAWTAIAVNG